MANTAESGIFSPIVVVVKKALGQKQFNQVRGKAISLHSQGAQLSGSCMSHCRYLLHFA